MEKQTISFRLGSETVSALDALADTMSRPPAAGQRSAAAHGLQRWQQGYDLREVTRELGKLNECVVAELEDYTKANPAVSSAAIAASRRICRGTVSRNRRQRIGCRFQAWRRM